MAGEKLLIIEDEVKIARFVELELNHEGYSVDIVHDGRKGLEMAAHGNYELIILDVMLPSLNGMEVLRRIRQTLDTPIIMLTAKDEIMDKVMGLDMGADDYITKPFAIEELLARIRSALKRKNNIVPRTGNKIEAGPLTINMDRHMVSFEGSSIDLTKKEYDLLKYLVDNKNIVLTRDQILETVWGYDFCGDTNIVDVYIRYLRGKIDDRFNVKLIHTLRGVGYIFKYE